MADISKCTGTNCPYKRETCYRYTAPASNPQSYILHMDKKKKCEHYTPNDGHKAHKERKNK